MTFRARVFPLSACLLLLGFAACNRGPSAPSTETAPAADTRTVGAVTTPTPSAGDFAPASELSMLHFELDRHELRAGDQGAVDQTARWLKSRPEMMVQIAGHADERGTEAYNLALAERRAQSIKRALTKRGIDARRIMTASYGENRPLCPDRAEGCWAKNRRAEFLVKAQ